MNLHRKYLFAVLGASILGASGASLALTLERASGAVLLGQPLRLTVPIRLEPEEGAASLCLGADVFYGDTRQADGRVEVTSEYSAQSHSATAYIRAYASVDEPVVTVYVRAGCEQRATRRYLLLAELTHPTSGAQASNKVPPQAAYVAPVAAMTGAVVGSESAALPRPSKQVAAVAPKPRADAALSARATPRTPTAADHRPRLKLVPLDLQEDRGPALRFSHDMLEGDSGDLQRRAQAVALWQSLNATPQDLAQADGRRQSLEKNLRVLHETTRKNRDLLQELSARLERAESERYSNPLVFGLFGVLAACVLGFAHAIPRLRRSRHSAGPWWRDDGSPDRSDMAKPGKPTVHWQADGGQTLPPEPIEPPAVVKPEPAPPEPLVPRMQEVDIDLQLALQGDASYAQTVPDSAGGSPQPVEKTMLRSQDHVDFANSLNSTMRAVNMQEMLDVRQQAEFFMALGQHQEAIAVLRAIIDADSDANPLVYLDLLKILHDLGRKMEYDQYRIEFNATFSGYVPVYTEFNERGGGLEAYPVLCRRIAKLWPFETVVSYIEECLVSTHGAATEQVLSLEAFRDLLMLHGVARRIVSSFESGFLPFSAARQDTTQPVAVWTGSSGSTSVDLDLSDPPGNLIEFDTDDLLPLSETKGPLQKPG